MTLRKRQFHLISFLQDFTDCTSEQLQNIVQTNLVGSLLCARGAWRVMRRQTTGGHIFNIDGAGADGSPTPQYAAYGATKAGMLLAPNPDPTFFLLHKQILLGVKAIIQACCKVGSRMRVVQEDFD